MNNKSAGYRQKNSHSIASANWSARPCAGTGGLKGPELNPVIMPFAVNNNIDINRKIKVFENYFQNTYWIQNNQI